MPIYPTDIVSLELNELISLIFSDFEPFLVIIKGILMLNYSLYLIKPFITIILFFFWPNLLGKLNFVVLFWEALFNATFNKSKRGSLFKFTQHNNRSSKKLTITIIVSWHKRRKIKGL